MKDSAGRKNSDKKVRRKWLCSIFPIYGRKYADLADFYLTY